MCFGRSGEAGGAGFYTLEKCEMLRSISVRITEARATRPSVHFAPQFGTRNASVSLQRGARPCKILSCGRGFPFQFENWRQWLTRHLPEYRCSPILDTP